MYSVVFVEQETNMSSETQEKGRKQKIQMSVDDDTIAKLAEVAKEVEKERQNNNSNVINSGLTK